MILGPVRSFVISCAVVVFCACIATAQSAQPPSPNIGGVWVLNPALTQRPAEIGFTPDWARGAGPEGAGGARPGGGRGRRGGGGGGAAVPMNGVPVSRETADDSTRVDQLTAEARTPPDHITIVQKAEAVSIADDQGHSRTFHPNGQLEELTIGTTALPTTTRWDAGKLIVAYDVGRGRQLRYTYTPSADPHRLLVDIRFIDQGQEGDEVRLTYEPPEEHDRAILSGQPTMPFPPEPSAGAPPAVPETTPAGAPGGRPALLPPGSELRGISTITTVVDDLTAQAAACGLDQTRIQTSITKILADGGFKTQTYGREDADLLVSVVTSKLPDGACASRYDASLVSHADATFPYLKGTVAAVEVQLLHDGGMVGGSPSSHASAVTDALAKSVNHFVSRIHAAANK